MTITTANDISSLVAKQRSYFAKGETKDIHFRLRQLAKLKEAIASRQDKILEALKADLGKPPLEGCFELAVLRDIGYAQKNLRKWVKPQAVNTGIELFPSLSRIYPEPLGVVLIIGPWNYPFSLMISPLIGAIAAGNCVILKPSEYAPNTSRLLAELISDTFPPEYIAVIEGGVEVAQELLQCKFDHIFFTGGTRVGKIVMEAAAKHLTPVTLELGGKSPCIVDNEVQLLETAKRITWGKFINAGQTCIAPDYVLAHKDIKSQLIEAIKQCIRDFYGENPALSPDYARIVNLKQWERLVALLADGTIITGGQYSREDRYIAPTILDEVNPHSPIMQEEIFGPILPILSYNTLEEAIEFVNNRPKPLALYFFSKNRKKQETILRETSSGGVCINETILHVGVTELPFGGVGDSGIGKYHGKATFDTFSHYKSVLIRPFWPDFSWRYPPYSQKALQLFQKMFAR